MVLSLRISSNEHQMFFIHSINDTFACETHTLIFQNTQSEIFTRRSLFPYILCFGQALMLITNAKKLFKHARVWYLRAKYDFHTYSVISTRRSWFPHAQVWFIHAGVWFWHEQLWFTHPRVCLLHEECDFHTQSVVLTRCNQYVNVRLC
jgi:hypothetical protein